MIPLQYAPVITPTSLGRVHHMQVYLCEGLNYTGHPEVGVVRECNGIAADVSPCRAASVLSGWAIGATVRHYYPLKLCNVWVFSYRIMHSQKGSLSLLVEKIKYVHMYCLKCITTTLMRLMVSKQPSCNNQLLIM